MKTTTAIKMATGVFMVSLMLNALAADPAISDVVARQRWPWSRLVDIDYVITDATQAVDIVVNAFTGEQQLT